MKKFYSHWSTESNSEKLDEFTQGQNIDKVIEKFQMFSTKVE